MTKHAETAIVIPTFNSIDLIKKHVSLLKKQTYTNFDIIIVDSGKSRDHVYLKKFRKDVVVKYFKKDLGGGGSFYEGERYAFERGYRYIILADSDAFPISKNLVGELIGHCNDRTAVVPTNIFEKLINQKRVSKIEENPFHYLTVSKEIVREVGYIDRRMFFWADDVDYTRRIAERFNLLELGYVYYNHIAGLGIYFTKGIQIRPVYYAIRNSLISRFGNKLSIIFGYAPIYSLFVIKYGNSIRMKVIYLGWIIHAVLDGILKIGGGRTLPDIKFNLGLEKVENIPKNSLYLTVAGDPNLDKVKKIKYIKRVDVTEGITTINLLRYLLRYDNFVVRNYNVNKYISIKLLPFAIFKNLFIYTDSGIFKICKEKQWV